VKAFAFGYKGASVSVDPTAAEPLDIRLGRELLARVSVVDVRGGFVPVPTVCFYRETSRTCSSGGANPREQQIEEATYTILAVAAGFGTRVLEQRVAAREDGQPVDVTASLLPGAPLVIRLAGRPAEGARVVALIDPAGADRAVLVRERETDPATGEARWPTWPLEAGAWRVVVDPGTGETLDKEITVASGGPQEVVFP
jgi:hypothetical protein